MKCCGCCGCCPESFRKEFQLRKCGLSCSKPSTFYVWQFKWPVIALILFKGFFAVYVLAWLIYNLVEAPGAEANNNQVPIVFLTTWSFILLDLYLFASLIDAIYMTFNYSEPRNEFADIEFLCCRDGHITSITQVIGHHIAPPKDEEVESGEMLETDRRHVSQTNEYGMTWYHRVVWVLHDMISVAAPLVTLIYFPFLLPLAMKENPEFAASPLDINIHGVNTIIMLLDNFFTAIPVRLLHVIYPITYGAVYVIFSAIYFAFDPENHIVYPGLLDWRSPGVTIAVIIVVVGVLLPLIQLAWYGWYRLRLWTFRKFYHHDYCDPTML